MENNLKMFQEFYHTLDQWLTLYEDGVSVASILKKNGFHKIAIYGMGSMALHLIKALENTDVTVECIIIENKADYYVEVPVLVLTEVNVQPDVVIYTNPNEKTEVIRSLTEKLHCNVISLTDLIFDNVEV